MVKWWHNLLSKPFMLCYAVIGKEFTQQYDTEYAGSAEKNRGAITSVNMGGKFKGHPLFLASGHNPTPTKQEDQEKSGVM